MPVHKGSAHSPSGRPRPLRNLSATLAALLTLGSVFAGVSSAASLHADALVVSIASGDTFTVRSGNVRTVVHLAGVRAPSTGQPHAAAAKRALGELLFGKRVDFRVTAQREAGNVDAEVRLGDVNVNAEMVRLGWAAVDHSANPGAFLVRSESEAKWNGRGMWAHSQGP